MRRFLLSATSRRAAADRVLGRVCLWVINYKYKTIKYKALGGFVDDFKIGEEKSK